SASNAALVGAKTVKGPSPCSVSTRSAALTAATSVVWSAEFIAFSTMFLSAYMAAPPTIGLSCAKARPASEVAANAPARMVDVNLCMSVYSSRISNPSDGDAQSYGHRFAKVSDIVKKDAATDLRRTRQQSASRRQGSD